MINGPLGFNKPHPSRSPLARARPFPASCSHQPSKAPGAEAPGQVVCVSPQVYPIVDFPLREISLASQRGIAEHSAALASRARVLQQVS